MDSVESSLKSRSIVDTSEALIARPRPRAANTYSIGLRALLMYTRNREMYVAVSTLLYMASCFPADNSRRNRQTKYGTQQVRKRSMVKKSTWYILVILRAFEGVEDVGVEGAACRIVIKTARLLPTNTNRGKIKPPTVSVTNSPMVKFPLSWQWYDPFFTIRTALWKYGADRMVATSHKMPQARGTAQEGRRSRAHTGLSRHRHRSRATAQRRKAEAYNPKPRRNMISWQKTRPNGQLWL